MTVGGATALAAGVYTTRYTYFFSLCAFHFELSNIITKFESVLAGSCVYLLPNTALVMLIYTITSVNFISQISIVVVVGPPACKIVVYSIHNLDA